MLALRKRYQVFGRGDARVPAPREPPRARLRARATRSERSWSSPTCRASPSTSSSTCRAFTRLGAGRAVRPDPLPADRRAALPAHARAPRGLLARLEAPREEAPTRDGEPGCRPSPRAARSTRWSPGAAAAELERALAGFLPSAPLVRGKARGIRSRLDHRRAAARRRPLDPPRPRADRAGRVHRGRGRDLRRAARRCWRASAPSDLRGRHAPRSVVARGRRRGETAVLVEALVDPDVCRALLEAVRRRRRLKGSDGGRLSGGPPPALRDALDGAGGARAVDLPRRAEQHLGGLRPVADPEALPARGGRRQPRPRARALPGRAGRLRPHAAGRGRPRVPAATAASRPRSAILHDFVPNEGDAWQYTLDALGRFYEEVVTDAHRARRGAAPEPAAEGLLDRAPRPVPEEVDEVVGSYLQSAAAHGPRGRRAARRARRRRQRPGARAGAVHAALPALASTSRCAT